MERLDINGIRQQQRQACEEAVCRYYKSIYLFLAYLTRETNLAEDLTQETFVSAWANIGNYKGQAEFGVWLHKIAYHKFIDLKRRDRRRADLMAMAQRERKDAATDSNPLHRLKIDEHFRILYQAIGKLESAEYLVIVLHYIQGLSFREMAKVLDEAVGTTKWRTNKALKCLKGYLDGRVEL